MKSENTAVHPEPTHVRSEKEKACVLMGDLRKKGGALLVCFENNDHFNIHGIIERLILIFIVFSDLPLTHESIFCCGAAKET